MSFVVSVGVSWPDTTPLLIRFAWAFWRALIHGVPAKLDAEVTARTSEARSKVFMASLPLLGQLMAATPLSALNQRCAQHDAEGRERLCEPSRCSVNSREVTDV